MSIKELIKLIEYYRQTYQNSSSIENLINNLKCKYISENKFFEWSKRYIDFTMTYFFFKLYL